MHNLSIRSSVKQRYSDVISLLNAWAPLTVNDVLRASLTFAEPYLNAKECRRELRAMWNAGYLGRRPIPDTGRGQKPYAYHLRRRAADLVASVADIPKSNSLFHGIGRNPWHSLAIGEVGALLEAHAATTPSVTILERVRDRQFRADLSPHNLPRLIPDGTVLVHIKGRLKVFFIELVHETATINPGAEGARARSLAGKLEKFKAFNTSRRLHPTWWAFERAYGYVGGFQVLVVTTKRNAQYIQSAAPNTNTMCVFAELDALRATENVFVNDVWWLPPSARWQRTTPVRTSLIAL